MIREESIKWLESLKAEIGKAEHRTLWHYAEAIDMAIEALKELPKRRKEAKRWKTKALQAEPKTGEWIPCSERLPNEDECGWYLVTAKGHELFVDVIPFNDKLWKGLYSNQEVLAWKPLPMPYREESEV